MTGAGLGAMPLRSLCRRPAVIFAPDCTLRETLAGLRRAGAEGGLVIDVSPLRTSRTFR